ncbi:MAG: preprotein translocase subunit SecG [Proteobacteria bacterium]|nr:preprotein translocase subunit SecG [Pseudomonadota bacterium]
MLNTILTVLHVMLSAAIIGLVLLQRGKGADAGAGFGSGASGTVFGARGSSTFFSKLTAVLATCFFVTSLSLAYLASHRGAGAPKSLVDQVPLTQPAPVPAPASELPAVPAAPAGEPPASNK